MESSFCAVITYRRRVGLSSSVDDDGADVAAAVMLQVCCNCARNRVYLKMHMCVVQRERAPAGWTGWLQLVVYVKAKCKRERERERVGWSIQGILKIYLDACCCRWNLKFKSRINIMSRDILFNVAGLYELLFHISL